MPYPRMFEAICILVLFIVAGVLIFSKKEKEPDPPPQVLWKEVSLLGEPVDGYEHNPDFCYICELNRYTGSKPGYIPSQTPTFTPTPGSGYEIKGLRLPDGVYASLIECVDYMCYTSVKYLRATSLQRAVATATPTPEWNHSQREEEGLGGYYSHDEIMTLYYRAYEHGRSQIRCPTSTPTPEWNRQVLEEKTPGVNYNFYFNLEKNE